MTHGMTGTLEGVTWPPMFTAHAPLAALVEHLGTTQWLTADELRALQGLQLAALIAFHAAHSPNLQVHLAAAKLTPAAFADTENLAHLPIQSRAALNQIAATAPPSGIPAAQLPVVVTQSSGSTGTPVTVRKTQVNSLMWSALTVRFHRWSEPNGFGRLAIIRADLPEIPSTEHWPPPVSLLHKTGPSCFIPLNSSLGEQAAELAAFEPDSLLAYPGNVAALLQTEAGRAALASVRSIKTFSETVSPELREDIAAETSAHLFDSYSTQEVGYIALQCPEFDTYHLMSEALIIEIVDEEGRACPPGTVGRVLVTDLLNLATPIIRYDIGDYAALGEPCPCGRGLPTLSRIMGRKRGMMLTHDGSRQWPIALFRQFASIAPVIQYQLIQHEVDRFDLRIASPGLLTLEQQAQLTNVLQTAIGKGVSCTIRSFADRLPPGPGGKTDEFICLIGA